MDMLAVSAGCIGQLAIIEPCFVEGVTRWLLGGVEMSTGGSLGGCSVC